MTVNAFAAALYSYFTFASTNAFTITDGNNTFTAIASDSLGRGDTNAVTINLPATNSYSYDLNGNLLSVGTRTFDYDDENRLVAVLGPPNAVPAEKTTFVYDGLGRMREQLQWTTNSGGGGGSPLSADTRPQQLDTHGRDVAHLRRQTGHSGTLHQQQPNRLLRAAMI